MGTSIITNGYRMADDAYVKSFVGLLDWVTVSIDSAKPEVHEKLGRGIGPRAKTGENRPLPNDHYFKVAELVHKYGMKLKISTVVNALNKDEDMSEFMMQMQPKRWKLFQCLYIEGENTGRVEHLLVGKEEMEAFVARHQHLTQLEDSPIPMYSSTEETKNGYACITPAGCFLDDIDNNHRYSRPILSVGVDAAWEDIDYRPENFRSRGGFYDWQSSGTGQTCGDAVDIEDIATANQDRVRAKLEKISAKEAAKISEPSAKKVDDGP